MSPLQFETRQAPRWDELAFALDIVEKRKSRRSPGAAKAAAADAADAADVGDAPDPARLAALYRSACEDLALARARAYPVHLTDRLDELTRRAHQAIYRRSDYGWHRLTRLVLLDFPQAVRAHRGYMLVAALVFALPLFVLGLVCHADPGFILSVHDVQTVRQYDRMYGPGSEPIGRERDADTDWQMFGHYIDNNISIAFKSYASGVFLGIGSLLVLAFNGGYAGALAGFLTARGHGEAFYSFVVTHGAFELTAIVISGAAGLSLGHALLAPGRRTRLQALQRAAADGLPLMYGTIAMLVIAAAIEAFWSSARWIAPGVKYGVGAACWAFVLLYLARQGRPRAAAQPHEGGDAG